MIELYRVPSCERCDAVEEVLQDLTLAHRVIDLHQDPEAAVLDLNPPYLKEGEHLYATERSMEMFLTALRYELTVSREMQSDTCVVDPDSGAFCVL